MRQTRVGSGGAAAPAAAIVAALAAAAAVLCVAASAAGAQDANARRSEGLPFAFGNSAEPFFLLGVTGGGAFGSPGSGGFVGGEFSGVWLKEGVWGGLYGDAVYDFATASTVVTFGPEVGWWVLGLDGGPGVRLGYDDEPELGYQGRLTVALGTLGIFGRYLGWPDSRDAEHVFQVGATFKLPVWNATEPVDPVQ